MGVFIESPGLAAALAGLIERDMLPANGWRFGRRERERQCGHCASQVDQNTVQPARTRGPGSINNSRGHSELLQTGN